MNISSVEVKLNEQDILSIINDFVSVKGLIIDNIEINENIVIYGSYTKGIKIPFKANVNLEKIEDNKVSIKINKVNALKLPISKHLMKIVLKGIGSTTEKLGIIPIKEGIEINFNILNESIPYVDFRINNITLYKKYMVVEASKVVYSEDKEVIEKNLESNNYEDFRNKTKDYFYNNKSFAEYVLFVPDVLALLWGITKDKRVKKSVKYTLVALLTYVVIPVDIIPDSIPIFGQIDDVGIVFFIFNKIIKQIPEEVINDNWKGDRETLEKVKFIAKTISEFFKVKNNFKVDTIVSVGKKIIRK